MFSQSKKLLQLGIWWEACPKLVQHWRISEAYHQTSIVEIEGMIKDKPISIFNDIGASLSYVSPRIVEMCKLSQEKLEKLGWYS